MFSLSGKTAIVTGAAGNLGPVWIRGLVAAGANVIGICFPGTEESAAEQIDDPHVELMAADICDRSALDKTVSVILSQHGAPHVLVANAGIDVPPVASTDQNRPRAADSLFDEFRRLVDVNLIGSFQSLQAFGTPMLERRRGSIILIGSIYAELSPDAKLYNHLTPPFLKNPAYGASKAGVVSLAKQFATQWAPFRVRVNTLSPGGMFGKQDPEFVRKYSERVPLGRMGQAEDVIGALVFLASDASAYVTGHNLVVDGGFTLW